MFRKMIGISAFVGGVFILGGCVIDGSESGVNATVETQTETYIDLDNSKDGALGLIFGMPPIDDRLDYAGGDREDWRYIVVTEPGMMSIRINVDAPQSLEGGWNIIDSEGRTLHREAFSKSQGFYEPAPFPVKRGVYYFQTFATSGKSIYTIGTTYNPSPAVPETQVVAYNEPEEEEEYVADSSASSHHRTSHASKPSSDSGRSSASSSSKPKKEEAATGTRLVGEITVMTEKSDGSYEVTVKGVGKNKGVETGAIGTIDGTSIKIEMTQCFSTSCRALIPEKANPKSLKKGAKVIFRI